MSVFDSPFNQVFRNPFDSPYSTGLGGGGAFAWTPALWFLASEQGIWLDPSDMTTMFQDSAGATPVTAVEQSVGKILDKSGRGNHATQPTTAAKPKLSARKNWLTYSEDFSNAAWAKGANAAVTANTQVAPDGATTADTYTSSGAADALWYSLTGMVASAPYTFSIRLKQGTGRWVKIVVGANGYRCWVDTQTATLGTAAAYGTGTLIGATVTALADGWMLVRLSGTNPVTSTYTQLNSVTADAVNTQASGTCYVWGAQFEYGSAATTYQRIAAATDYDAVGFPHYLAFDGVDDFLSTGSIDFTATDAVTLVSGIRKGSDAAQGIAVELGASTAANPGFTLAAPAAASSSFAFRSAGTALADASDTGFASPYTGVVSGTADISGDSCLMRVNGVQEATVATDQGTGNYPNAVLYIGRRAGTSLPANMGLYQLTVRGAATADLTPGESFTATKTGISL